MAIIMKGIAESTKKVKMESPVAYQSRADPHYPDEGERITYEPDAGVLLHRAGN